MVLQRFSVAKGVGLLMARGSDNDEELSKDEMIGDFMVTTLFCLVKCCL